MLSTLIQPVTESSQHLKESSRSSRGHQFLDQLSGNLSRQATSSGLSKRSTGRYNLDQGLLRSLDFQGSAVTGRKGAGRKQSSLEAIRESYQNPSKLAARRENTLKSLSATRNKAHQVANKSRETIAAAKENNIDKESALKENIRKIKVVQDRLEEWLKDYEARLENDDLAVGENAYGRLLAEGRDLLGELLLVLGNLSGQGQSLEGLKGVIALNGTGRQLGSGGNVLARGGFLASSQYGGQYGGNRGLYGLEGLLSGLTRDGLGGVGYGGQLTGGGKGSGGATLSSLAAFEQSASQWLETLSSGLNGSGSVVQGISEEHLAGHLKGFFALLNQHLTGTLGQLSEWHYQHSLTAENTGILGDHGQHHSEGKVMLKKEAEQLLYQKELQSSSSQSPNTGSFSKQGLNQTSPLGYSHGQQGQHGQHGQHGQQGQQGFYGQQQQAGYQGNQGYFGYSSGGGELVKGGFTERMQSSAPQSSQSPLSKTPAGVNPLGLGEAGRQANLAREFNPFTARLSPSVLLQKIVGGIKSASVGGREIFTLTLKPENLGHVAVLMKKTNDQFVVKLIVENSSVKSMVEDQLSDIKSQLAKENIDLTALDVDIEYRDAREHPNNGKTAHNMWETLKGTGSKDNNIADLRDGLHGHHASALSAGTHTLSLVI